MYGGSSIYVVSERYVRSLIQNTPADVYVRGVMERFGVGQAAAALGLSMYVIGCETIPLQH